MVICSNECTLAKYATLIQRSYTHQNVNYSIRKIYIYKHTTKFLINQVGSVESYLPDAFVAWTKEDKEHRTQTRRL